MPSNEAAFFAEHGYAVVSSFVHAHELGLLRSQVNKIAASPPDPIMARPGNHLFPLRWNDAVVSQFLLSAARHTPSSKKIFADNGLADLCSLPPLSERSLWSC
jgi:hypothetical protein